MFIIIILNKYVSFFIIAYFIDINLLIIIFLNYNYSTNSFAADYQPESLVTASVLCEVRLFKSLPIVSAYVYSLYKS